MLKTRKLGRSCAQPRPPPVLLTSVPGVAWGASADSARISAGRRGEPGEDYYFPSCRTNTQCARGVGVYRASVSGRARCDWPIVGMFCESGPLAPRDWETGQEPPPSLRVVPSPRPDRLPESPCPGLAGLAGAAQDDLGQVGAVGDVAPRALAAVDQILGDPTDPATPERAPASPARGRRAGLPSRGASVGTRPGP